VKKPQDPDERARGFLPDHLKIEWEALRTGFARNGFTVEKLHMAPNGFMHAGSVVTLADSACGFACMRSLPEGANNFATIELKTNLLGTARPGDRVTCEARLTHGGRNTQVWDAEARNETADKTIALFRCTQMILYPR
jgi:1,4-dihydroxy-2-naphthoyl-CoA hydrolase